MKQRVLLLNIFNIQLKMFVKEYIHYSMNTNCPTMFAEMQFCMLIYKITGGRKLDKQATNIHVSDAILAQLMGITVKKMPVL